MEVEVPDTIVTTQAREKYASMMAEFRDQGMADAEIKKLITPENFLKYKDIYKPDIIKDFKVTLAVEELAKIENIEVPAYQIEEQIENLKAEAAQAGDDVDESMLRQRVETTLQSRLVFDFLAENADLDVEFVDEADQAVDEEMLQKLADDTLKREGAEEGFDAVQDAEVVSDAEQGEETTSAATVIEEESAVVEEEETVTSTASDESEPADVLEQPKSEEDEEALAAKYAAMPPDERAFNILLDLGMVELTPDPDSPDYVDDDDE